MHIQTDIEERYNALSHGLGALLGICALVMLVIYDTHKTAYSVFSLVVYGVSIFILFSASTLYHAVKNEKKRHLFRIIDHISIYLLIAGTYTPVLLIALEKSKGWVLFYTVWGIALLGMVLKIFFTGRVEVLSTLLYLVMGWLIVLDVSALSAAIGQEGIAWLFAGGLFYTIGIVFYALRRMPFHHVIWHLFVLAGAISHFFMIFLYVI